MKKIGACVLMATVAMGSKAAEKEKSTLEINWKNNKGETKNFKVNDIEQEFKPDQVRAKTLIQGKVTPLGFAELGKNKIRGRQENSVSVCSSRGGRSASASVKQSRSGSKSVGSRLKSGKLRAQSGRSCSEKSVGLRSASGKSGRLRSASRRSGRLRSSSRSSRKFSSGSGRFVRGGRKLRSASGDSCSRGRSNLTHSFRASSSRRASASYRSRSRSRNGSCNGGSSVNTRRRDSFRSRSRASFRSRSRSVQSGKRLGLTKRCNAFLALETEKGNVCSVSCSRSRGECGLKGGYRSGSCYKSDFCSRSQSRSVCSSGRKKYVIHHKPKYVIKKNYIPRKKQNKLHKYKVYSRNHSKCSENVDRYNKDYDSKLNKLSVNDLEKLLKLNKNHKENAVCDKRSASKLRKSQQESKYLKDKDSKYLKKNSERSASCSKKNCFKNSNKNTQNKKKEHENERQNSLEAQKRHNLVNLNHKSNEALLMKEKDKDNLHSNDKIIEEFDKLEHFKKVEERCRSASKARHANVKKHQDMDKCQAKKSGEKTKEKRGRNKLRSNLDKNSDRFCNLDKNCEDRESKYLKDEKECSAENNRERSMSCKSEKSTFSANDNKVCSDKNSNCDLLNKKNKCSKDKKTECTNDDQNGYCKSNSHNRENEDSCFEKDAFFNDKCDIC